MGDARDRHVSLFSERIFKLEVSRAELSELGDGLLTDRARGVVEIHQGGIIGCDRDTKRARAGDKSLALVGREREHSVEVLDTREAILLLPGPIVPEVIRDVSP